MSKSHTFSVIHLIAAGQKRPVYLNQHTRHGAARRRAPNDEWEGLHAMNTNGYLLDTVPDGSRLGKLLSFLDEEHAVEHPPTDEDNPYEPAHVGYYQRTIKVEGSERRYATYIPPHFPTSGAGIFVFLPDGVCCEEGFAAGNWQHLCDKNGFAAILLESRQDGGQWAWRPEAIQKEMDYAEAVFSSSIARDLYSMNESTYYAMGFGGGGYPALVFALLYSSVFTGVAVSGADPLYPGLLEQLRTMASDGDPLVAKGRVPMPAWLLDSKDCLSAELQWLLGALDADESEEARVHNDLARVYRQNAKRFLAWINGLPLAEVWHSGPEQLAGLGEAQRNERMAAFLLRTKRWMAGGHNNGDFRAARTARDMRLQYFEMCVDGRKRHWYLYVPSEHRRHPDKKLPVVLALHGYSCTGKLYAENSEWHTVAEKRGFFVLYPTAWPGRMGGTRTPLPLWNCRQFLGEEGIDDVKFLRLVLEETINKLPVDEERVYAAGHSNGSGMTQLLMQEAGELFAAFGPQGYTWGEAIGVQDERWVGNAPVFPDDGLRRPVWLMKGEHDVGCAADLSEDSANAKALRAFCRVNGADYEAARRYENGEYRHHSYYGADGVPYVRFTEVINLPHVYSPEMALQMWDEFFCRFRRRNGAIEYLG